MGVVQELAADLGVEERTLRRAVAQGMIRCRRSGPRRLRLVAGEREYLRGHWELLAALRRALRTERGVKLAVLYGSMARGDDDAGSDLDLLVVFADDRPANAFELAMRLERVAGRRVDVAHLERVEAPRHPCPCAARLSPPDGRRTSGDLGVERMSEAH